MSIVPFNRFGVGIQAGHVVVLMPPRILHMEQAMEFAAWLVVMARLQADTNGETLPTFEEYVAAVVAS